MNPYWHIFFFSLGMLLCLLLGAFLAALSFAIAAQRFPGMSQNGRSNGEQKEAPLSPTAKFCISHAENIAPLISLGRRFLFAMAAGFAFLICSEVLELLGIIHNTNSDTLIFILASAIVLGFTYAFFDLPAAHLGKVKHRAFLNSLPSFLKVFYYPAIALEYIPRAVSKKFFGRKIYGEAAYFNYMDVDIALRTKESESDTISPYTGKIVTNALKLQELDVSDVMLPRSQVVYFDVEESNEENIVKARIGNHTRYPLCKDNLDNCYGIIHIKDIFMSTEPLEKIDFMKIKHETLRLKETDKLETALAKLLKYKLHMALVEDEFGGTIGLLTLDEALGELVGQIRDEFDSAQDQTIRAIGRDTYKISGLAILHKVEDFLDVDFDTDEVSTFGGLITLSLGRFPEKGEKIYFKPQNMTVTVDTVEERMVGECTVKIEEAKE